MPHAPPEMLLPTTFALLARSGPKRKIPVLPERLMSLERILVPVDSTTSTPRRELPMEIIPRDGGIDATGRTSIPMSHSG